MQEEVEQNITTITKEQSEDLYPQDKADEKEKDEHGQDVEINEQIE